MMSSPIPSRTFMAALFTAVLASATGVARQFPGPVPDGPGGMGGVQEDRPLVAQFDTNGDRRLDAAERKAARAFIESQPAGGFGVPGFGPPGGGRGGVTAPAAPSPRFDPASARSYPAGVPFYDLATLRTLIIQFENDDWGRELVAFNNTDVEVPATLTVDGHVYRDVGVHTRGLSSFMAVPQDGKHSLNVSLDFAHKDQTIDGYSTLNLLNAHEDPSYLRAVLYLQAAREFLPAAQANYVRVVVNGENRGIFTNVEQVNKTFIQKWYKTTGGTRWKVPGSPMGRGGLEYTGDDPAPYRRIFEIKTRDDPKAWAALVNLTKVLTQTPLSSLEAALTPVLDIDETLRFLALEATLVNNDGYWIRASDYNLYLDVAGKFHILPHDVNESFAASGMLAGPGRGFIDADRRGGPGGPGRGPGGPGDFPPFPGGPNGRGDFPGFPGMDGRGGPGGPGFMMGGSADTDPLIGKDDASKPLRSRLLAVPSLRAKYLSYVKAIATTWLDWNTLGPLAQRYQALIAADVEADTRKLDSFEAFHDEVDSLRRFANARREYLLKQVAPE